MASEKELNGSRKNTMAVKLPASALSFVLECPRCGFEGPANGVASKPFPRIFDDLTRAEGGEKKARHEAGR